MVGNQITYYSSPFFFYPPVYYKSANVIIIYLYLCFKYERDSENLVRQFEYNL